MPLLVWPLSVAPRAHAHNSQLRMRIEALTQLQSGLCHRGKGERTTEQLAPEVSCSCALLHMAKKEALQAPMFNRLHLVVHFPSDSIVASNP